MVVVVADEVVVLRRVGPSVAPLGSAASRAAKARRAVSKNELLRLGGGRQPTPVPRGASPRGCNAACYSGYVQFYGALEASGGWATRHRMQGKKDLISQGASHKLYTTKILLICVHSSLLAIM